MATPLRKLNRGMRERLIKALVNGLPTQLIDDLTEEGLEYIGPLPVATDYWDITAPDLGKMTSSDIAIAISNTQQTEYSMRLSGDAVTASVIVRARISVVALVKPPAGYPELMRNGRLMAQSEILELMADVYRGAILEVALRDAVDGETVLEIFPVSDFADTITPDTTAGALGRAVIEFEISGQGTHPAPSYALER